jgi:hypothetical protein
MWKQRQKKARKRGERNIKSYKKLTDPCCCKEFVLQMKYDLGKPRQKRFLKCLNQDSRDAANIK